MVGCDINPRVVEMVNAGFSPVVGEAGLDEAVAAAVAKGLLTATTDTAEGVRGSDAVVVIVRVVVNSQKQPDLSIIEAATRQVANGLHPGCLVIYESTLPVGTVRDHLRPLLEESGLTAGRDFFLAFSPERVSTGRIFRDLQEYPKIVGGINPESTEKAVAFYRAVLDAEVRAMSSLETAEFVKLAETTYRDVNIALANQLARYAVRHGIDATEAFKAANSQPYSHLHDPGVGVGGHCIPVYPHFLLNGAGDLPLVELSRRTNDGMAAYAVDRLAEALGSLDEKTILILGLAYRGGVKEDGFSSAFLLAQELGQRGAHPIVHDPLYSAVEIEARGLAPADLASLPRIEAVILQSYHDEYKALDFSRFDGCKAVVDGRNVLDRRHIESVGMKYIGIGR